MSKTPIRRIEALQPLSREHHDGLLFCWKLKQGLQKNISFERIKTYSLWFYRSHLEHHFAAEEQHLFPLLGNEHQDIKTAIQQHRELEKLFSDISSENIISDIAELLQEHIRFEERVLFNEIQEIVPAAQLEAVEKHSGPVDCGNWEDEFWK